MSVYNTLPGWRKQDYKTKTKDITISFFNVRCIVNSNFLLQGQMINQKHRKIFFDACFA